MRATKSVAAGVDEFAFEVFGVSEGDAVDYALESAVGRFQFVESFGDLLVAGDVAHETFGAREIADEVGRFGGHALVLIGDGQLPAVGVKFLCDGPRDAALVGEAEDYGGFFCVGHCAELRSSWWCLQLNLNPAIWGTIAATG